MDILGTARRLESALSQRLDRAADRLRSPGPPEALELAHAIVDAVAQEVQPGGRGRYVFPYHRVKVTIAAPTKDARAQIEAVLDGKPSLRDRIIERLTSAGCDADDVDVKIAYVAAAHAAWTDPFFNLDLARTHAAAPAAAPRTVETPGPLKLTVEHGKAEKNSYTFLISPIYLGRCSDVRDSRHRLIRSNHVAFADGGVEANASVSRRHAHIAYDAAAGHHRVCDDRSEHGTGILRSGRLINVPAGPRGIRLQPGDVIVLGEARVRVS